MKLPCYFGDLKLDRSLENYHFRVEGGLPSMCLSTVVRFRVLVCLG